MPRDKKPLDKKILDWLNTQGYPLEMAVAQALYKSGFHVTQSATYEDTETGKTREIDIIATGNSSGQHVHFHVGATIECKMARDKPWLLFLPQTTKDTLSSFGLLGSSVANVLLLNIDTQSRLKHLRSQIQALRLCNPPNVAYGVTDAFGTTKDVPYEAVTTAVKASLSQVLAIDKFNKLAPVKLCTVMFPVIVADTRLFECRLDNTGEINIEEVQSGFVRWSVPGPTTRQRPLASIVTRLALDSFIQDLVIASNTISNMGVELETEAIEHFGAMDKLGKDSLY